MTRRRSPWERTRRSLYLTQRTMGDVTAARRGRLGRRLIRRTTVARLLRKW